MVRAHVLHEPSSITHSYCFKQVAIKFLERGAGIGRGVLREVLNHR